MDLEHDLAMIGQIQPGQRLRLQHGRLRVDKRYYFARLQRYISGDTPTALLIHVVYLTNLLRNHISAVLQHDAANVNNLYILVHRAVLSMQHLAITYPSITWPDWNTEHDRLSHAVKRLNNGRKLSL